MKTTDLNAYQNELIRDILSTNDLKILQKMRRAYHRAMKVSEVAPSAPYTMEELNARIDEAEADFAAGKGVPAEVAHQGMKQFIANL